MCDHQVLDFLMPMFMYDHQVFDFLIPMVMNEHQVFDFLIPMVVYQNQYVIFWDDHGYQPRLIPGRGLVQFLRSAPVW